MKRKPTDIKQFLDTNDVPFEQNDRSRKYFAIIDKIDKKNKKVIAILYFFKVILGITSMETMFVSAQKMKRMFYALKCALKHKTVTDEWDGLFSKFVTDSNKRLDYVLKIIRENLFLTEYYPFFREIGLDSVFSYELTSDFEANDRYFYGIRDQFEEWKSAHKEEIEAHMAKAQPMIDALAEQARRVKEKEEAEKKARAEYRKSITAEIRQRKKYDAEREKAGRKLQREFERYYA